jgi:parallel beta-helix repeat protein
MKHINVLLILCLFILSGCDTDKSGVTTASQNNAYQQILLEKLIDAKSGDVIEIPEGKFPITRSLSLRMDGVTIRGAGMDKTTLDFSNQMQGAEGLLVNANNFTIEDIALENTIGDAIKVNDAENVVFRRVRVEWTGGPKTKNGAYGLYPVKSKNVLIEDCVAIGASDAGIYVGQSNNVIVRRNRAEFNVAGIEIENTINADVYENVATNNTGGILVFNMPALSQAGGNTRVFNNKVIENNTKNFGHKGTPVASVPAGSGIVINSNDKIEIFDNTIANNKTSNILISSLYTTGYTDHEQSESFDPYPESIYIHSNNFTGGGDSPDHLELKLLKTAMFGFNGKLPDILWDGYVDENKMINNVLPEELRICLNNGDIEMINVDAPNKYDNPRLVGKEHQCELPRLAAITLPENILLSE